jgi:tetratricopeptide (TPR) repeat protein
VTLAAYGRVWSLGFVGYDDPGYVYENPHVAAGLGRSGLAWAFTTTTEANWHPLTWLSLMLDASIGGADARVFHVTNLLLHVANTLLLFLLLDRSTGHRWRSAFVAALFAVHPLHVESVAWVAERKDVLSTLFWLITIAAYARYTARPSPVRYAAVFAALALGLLAKPMLVTLPLVLLLLDYWPLRRWGGSFEAESLAPPSRHRHVERGSPMDGRGGRRRSRGAGAVSTRAPEGVPRDGGTQRDGGSHPHADHEGAAGVASMPKRLILEKIPLFALAGASCVATLIAQKSAVQPLGSYPLSGRVSNALVSYVSYLWKMIWPRGLAIFYQYPRHALPLWKPAVAALLLVTVSVAAIRLRRSRPWLPVGWFWYVLTLVPVIGLVQVGSQAMADRYTYVPLIGIFIVAAWGAPDLEARVVSRGSSVEAGRSATPRGAPILASTGLLVVLVLAARTWVQVGHWRSTVALFTHAVEATRDNAVAHNLLASALEQAGESDLSLAHLREALRIAPGFADAHFELTRALIRRKEIDEAASLCLEEQAVWPSDERTLVDLGLLAMVQGKYDEAASRFVEVLRANPDSVDAHLSLSFVRQTQGRIPEMISHYAEVIRLIGPEGAQKLSRRATAAMRGSGVP